MLQAYPTKNGTGVSVFGDYGDLNALYATVHHVAQSLNESDSYQKGQHQLLMNFAYEIRHAYSGHRLTQEMSFHGDDHKLHYFGFQLVWSDILIFIAALRHNIGYIRSGRLNQANIYLLEHVVEEALFAYHPAGAAEIKTFIGQRLNVNSEYAFIIYQAIHLEIVKGRPGKTRFRRIPHYLVNYFSTWTPEYKELIASFEVSAKKNECKVTDLEFDEFPEIKW